MFLPFTVWINCSSDLKKSSLSLDFFFAVGQNNLGNKILFQVLYRQKRLLFQWNSSGNSDCPLPSPLLTKFWKKKFICSCLILLEKESASTFLKNFKAICFTGSKRQIPNSERLWIFLELFWPRFHIGVLGMTFLFSGCIYFSIFYLDFYFPFLFGLLTPFFIWTFRDISRHFETFRDISRHFKTFQDISRHLDTSRHFETFQDTLRHFETFRGISRYFETFRDILIFFRSFQSQSNFGFLPNFHFGS